MKNTKLLICVLIFLLRFYNSCLADMRLETVGMCLEAADTYFDTADSFAKAADMRLESSDSSLAIDIRFAGMRLIAVVGIAADSLAGSWSAADNLTVVDNPSDNPADIVTADSLFAANNLLADTPVDFVDIPSDSADNPLADTLADNMLAANHQLDTTPDFLAPHSRRTDCNRRYAYYVFSLSNSFSYLRTIRNYAAAAQNSLNVSKKKAPCK